MTEYEAAQMQRYLERQIRRWKREEQSMKAAGVPVDEAAAKVRLWQAKQKDFLKQTGLKRRVDREQVVMPRENGTIKQEGGIRESQKIIMRN